jgi:hypothetical protein
MLRPVSAKDRFVLNWSDSTIQIAAKKSGPYKGLAIIGVRQDTNNSLVNSTVDIHGAVYMPNGAFDWTNTGTPPVTAKWTAWVVDGFSWDGSGTVKINFDVAGSDIPYPNGLIAVPFPGTPKTGSVTNREFAGGLNREPRRSVSMTQRNNPSLTTITDFRQ